MAANVHSILGQLQHLVRYAHWAYTNDDGAEFRSAAMDLHGDVNYRKLQIVTPFLKDHLRALTPNTHLHLGIRHSDTLVLAFRGTDFPFTVEDFVNPMEWWGFWGNVWTDFAFRMAPVPWLPEDSRALAHEGFLAAFNNLVADGRLRSSILHLVGGAHPRTIELCGHSLGAALATLCALWCKTQWPDANVTCVTLGSPRVGNEAFVEEFNHRGIDCYRLILDDDPIPTLPDRYTQALPAKLPNEQTGLTPAETKYQHVGTPILLHKGTDANFSSADLGTERADIEAEEEAGPLPRTVEVTYKWGGFAPYWTLRGAQMVPAILRSHDPADYSTVVQRVLEHAASEPNPRMHDTIMKLGLIRCRHRDHGEFHLVVPAARVQGPEWMFIR